MADATLRQVTQSIVTIYHLIFLGVILTFIIITRVSLLRVKCWILNIYPMIGDHLLELGMQMLHTGVHLLSCSRLQLCGQF